jgi:hypothetical protein
MKKKQLINLVYQQSQQITRLQKENHQLRDMFKRLKDNLMTEIANMIGSK